MDLEMDIDTIYKEMFKNRGTHAIRYDGLGDPMIGQHWIWNLVYRMTHNLQEAPKGYEELCQPENLGHHLDKMTSRRVIRTHQLSNTLPKDIWNKKCKVINMVRHPKDVAISFYKHCTSTFIYGYDGTWEGFLPMFLNEKTIWGKGWFTHIKDYMQRQKEGANVLILAFEECKRDTFGTVKKLAEFIGVQFSDEVYQKLVDETDIKIMQSRNAEYDLYAKKGRAGDVMYRKGDIGDWKQHFTTEQSELFNKVYKEKMHDTPFLYDNCLDGKLTDIPI